MVPTYFFRSSTFRYITNLVSDDHRLFVCTLPESETKINLGISAAAKAPAIYQQYLINRKDTKYQTGKEARDAAVNAFLKAEASGDVQAQLDALDDI